MYKVAIGDREMVYLHFGKDGAETVVVLPGISLKSVMSSEHGIVAAYSILANNYDIYLFDHVRQEPEGYSIEGMAEDTLIALDILGCNRVHVIGISMGGMVAQAIALKEPEKVASLILCSTAMSSNYGSSTVLARWKDLAKQKYVAGLMESFGEYVYSPSFFQRFRNIILASGDGATDLDFQNFLISLKAVEGFNCEGEIQRISCPALVVGADEDRIFGTQAAHDLIEALRCEYFIYTGYGHAVYDEAPDFLEHVDAFLRKSRQDQHCQVVS